MGVFHDKDAIIRSLCIGQQRSHLYIVLLEWFGDKEESQETLDEQQSVESFNKRWSDVQVRPNWSQVVGVHCELR